jgi:hypothetical protein
MSKSRGGPVSTELIKEFKTVAKLSNKETGSERASVKEFLERVVDGEGLA